jgi:transcriptional regulator with XRE-family HTH domain
MQLGRATSPAQIGSEGERQQRTIPRAGLAVAFGLQNDLPMRRKSEPKSRSTKRTPRSAGVADIEIRRRIRLRRREKGITQTELAGHLGLTFHQVQKYEKAMSRVGAARLQQIAEMLGVDIPFFYDGDGKEERDVDSLLVFNSVFSLRLLRAYTAIKNRSVQIQLVSLVETIAASQR